MKIAWQEQGPLPICARGFVVPILRLKHAVDDHSSDEVML